MVGFLGKSAVIISPVISFKYLTASIREKVALHLCVFALKRIPDSFDKLANFFKFSTFSETRNNPYQDDNLQAFVQILMPILKTYQYF